VIQVDGVGSRPCTLARQRLWPGRAKPMAPKLTPEEVVTLQVLKGTGLSNAPIA
jgi:hypothetical protein